MKNQFSPIALFCYNRPHHLRLTIKYLKKNLISSKSKVYFFSDGAKNLNDQINVNKVRKIISDIDGFKEKKIILRKKNLGLAKNIVSGLDYIFKKEKKVIILEDDILTNKFFLKFINDGLNIYKDNKSVASIHGYIYPINSKNLKETFFIKGADCWGWGTWKRAWKKYIKDTSFLLNKINKENLTQEFNFNNTKNYYKLLRKNIFSKNKSWAVQWYASAFVNNMFTLYPRYSLVKNIGFDKNATNTKINYNLNTNFSNKNIIIKKSKVYEDLDAKKKIGDFFVKNKKTIFEKLYIKFFSEKVD